MTKQQNQQQHKDLPRIVEIKNLDRYGVFLTKTEWIEKIQNLSGEDGSFTKEWQFHYWFTSTKKTNGEQTIHVAIPLCFYNYPQEVTETHIDFELPEVFKHAQKSKNDAMNKFEELKNTEIFRVLSNFIGSEWEVYSFSNIHTHPIGINSFSSTDLNKSNDNPGVVYPLLEGKEIPHFTGIQMHIDGKTEIIHNEFRVFTRNEDYKIYEYGRCLTISSGFEEPYTEPEIKPETEIDMWFGQSRWQGIPEPRPKERKDYYLVDNMSNSEQIKDFVSMFTEILKNTDYEPAYNIDKKHIVEKKYTPTVTYGSTIYKTKQPTLFDNTKKKRTKKELIKKLEEYGVLKSYYKNKTLPELEVFVNRFTENTLMPHEVIKTRSEQDKKLIRKLFDIEPEYSLPDIVTMDTEALENEIQWYESNIGYFECSAGEKAIELLNAGVLDYEDIQKMQDEEILATYEKYTA